MCIMRTYETRGRTVIEPPPRRGNYTSHHPAGVMRVPREWRRSESVSVVDIGGYVFRLSLSFSLSLSLSLSLTILAFNFNFSSFSFEPWYTW